MPTMLVTGGCGFIGSHFIRHILQVDPTISVRNLDKLTYAGNPANLADMAHEERYRFIRGDIADRALVQSILEQGIHSIIRFAAESHVDRSLQDAGPFVHTNVVGTQVLLEAARQYGVERFVQISTDEVYGSLGPQGAFTEDSPLAPNSPYAASKAAGDLLARSYQHTYGLPVIITRCSNNYGPCQYPEKLIPLFITQLLANQPVPLYGDGLNVRDWIHVSDHVRALERVWRKAQVGHVYNIGGRCEITNRELTQLLLEIMGKPTSLIEYVPDRLGHDRRYAIDCSKIEEELGWKAQVDFAEGLRETVEWYRNNSHVTGP